MKKKYIKITDSTFMALSQENIDFIENKISKVINKGYPCVSPKDYQRMEEATKLIIESKPTAYIQFGGSGFNTISYYKALNSKIYVSEIYMNELYTLQIYELDSPYNERLNSLDNRSDSSR